ncbi:TlpA family protein disulfide reductase [Nocardioides gilvus]|uniref:TlpA family protein disulfide reductase n=1 Tax=Nocardioides gilvus TaxID=1735589 RepID=UPI0013A5A7EE|nr:TlpA disulfide reductase family protein [Nocardioides gilvus]
MLFKGRWVLGLLSAVVAVLVSACSPAPVGSGAEQGKPDAVTLGWYEVKGSPEVALPPGDPISDADWNTATPWILINFWASTCGPCRAEIPELNELSKANFIQVLGVSRDQFVKYAREFEDEVGAEFPSWMDSDGKYSESFVKHLPRNGLPVSVLVHQGELVAVHLGPIKSSSAVPDFIASTERSDPARQ